MANGWVLVLELDLTSLPHYFFVDYGPGCAFSVAVAAAEGNILFPFSAFGNGVLQGAAITGNHTLYGMPGAGYNAGGEAGLA